LKPQWKFFGEYVTHRFHLVDNSIVIEAKGYSIGNCSPLSCILSDHSFTAEVEVFIQGDTIGELVLFYYNSTYSGILTDHRNVLANLRGWQFPMEKDVIQDHEFLRLSNINNTGNMHNSLTTLCGISSKTQLSFRTFTIMFGEDS